MFKKLSIVLLAVMCSGFNAQKNKSNQVDRPKLVVGLVVDQMRWDYLYRYYEKYGDDGFKRLLKQGYSLNNVHINYIPTYTAIGHTTIYTGSVPAIHGIAGNEGFLLRGYRQLAASTFKTQCDTRGERRDEAIG